MLDSIKMLDKRKWKVTFIASIIAGFMTHLAYMIMQPEHADSIIFANIWKGTEYQKYSQGRWSVNFLTFFRGYLTSPVLTALITIVSVACMSILLIDLFEIEEVIVSVLIGIALQVHPAIANSIIYFSTSGTFYYALSILPIWMIYKINKKKNLAMFFSILIAVICLAYGQTTVCILTGLSVLMFLIRLIKGNELKTEIQYFFKDIILCGVSCLIYIIIWKALCRIFKVTYIYGGGSNYSVGNTIDHLFLSIKVIYLNFIESFFGNTIIHNSYWKREYIWGICLIAAGIIVLYFFLEDNIPKINKIIILIFLFLLPIAFFSIRIIVTEYELYLVMLNVLMLVIPFLAALLEKMKYSAYWIPFLKKVCYLCLVIIIWTYAMSDNAGYMLLNQTTFQSKNLAVRLLNRIEMIDEFDYNMPVCFIGSLDSDYFAISEKLYEISPGSTFNLSGVWDGVWEVSDGWGRYIEQYCGVKLNYYSNGMQDRIRELMETKEFRDMGRFPDNSCIQIIDGTLVVKLGE